jgi:MoxR-like ATPase
MDARANAYVPYDMETFKSMADAVVQEMRRVVIGKDELVYDIFIALLSRGNILLEGVPGVAKTTIAKSFAQTTGLDFRRVQFMPDIMPSDITGAMILNQKTMEFELHQGPIFTNILLADEVNRASPKVQSSLLEAMEERQVSIGRTTFRLPDPFMVITTQNPIDIIGTYPLPEAEIDRFMFKLNVKYPTPEEELEMLMTKIRDEDASTRKIIAAENVSGMISTVKSVHMDAKVLEYIRDLTIASRSHEKLLLGASPRASIALMKASRAVAALNGRDYVAPSDVKYLVPKVLNHRLIVKPEFEQEETTVDDIINELLANVKVPA